MPAALRMSNVDVPISDKARERIDDARAREINFYVRRLLERGGYRPEEIEAVAAVYRKGAKSPLSVESP